MDSNKSVINMGRSPNYGRNSNILIWHTGNQDMVKSAENRMRSNLEGCRTFRNLVVSYQFRTFISTRRFVINSLIKMLYV
jgi:hypothetical protein